MAQLTKSQQWFKDNVSENEQELMDIGEIAMKVLHDKLSIGLGNPLTTIAVYAKIFESICDVIVDQQEEWDTFCLNIADRLKVGYTTTSSEDDEKQGNFMVFMQHVDCVTVDDTDEEETDSIELCTQWNAANVKTQSDVIKQVAARGKKALGEIINLKIESLEFVVPVFCIIHAQIINYMRIKRVELNKSEYELNVAGLYTVGICENNGDEEIYFVPSISLKLRFKNDAIASGKNEE